MSLYHYLIEPRHGVVRYNEEERLEKELPLAMEVFPNVHRGLLRVLLWELSKKYTALEQIIIRSTFPEDQIKEYF